MRVLISIFLFFTFTNVSCISLAQQMKAERKPFQKSPHVIKKVTEHPQRELDDDSKSYNPNPRVVVADEKAGKYEFRWIGYDGKEKIIKYQRHDAIDGEVQARVEKTQEGKFLYKYLIKIYPSSPSRLLQFIVYTLAKDTQPVKQKDVHSGFREPLLAVKNSYIWLSFYPMHENGLIIDGGKSIEFGLESSSPAGLIRYWVSGGELGVLGVGEDIPAVLDDKIPFFEDLASGYTIGPVESLSGLSKSEKAKYILENLPKFQEAGWMGETTAKKYESILKKEDLTEAYEQAKNDLKNEFITSEVFHIIEGLQK